MTGNISAVAFSFIVQEPSGIIDVVSERSRASSRRMIAQHLRLGVMRVEDRMREEIGVRAPIAGCGRTIVERVDLAKSRTLRAAEERIRSLRSSASVVVSSSAMPIDVRAELAEIHPRAVAARAHEVFARRVAQFDADRVEETLVRDLEAELLQSGGELAAKRGLRCAIDREPRGP